MAITPTYANKEFIDGVALPASDLNTYVSNSLAYLNTQIPTSLVTTRGDLIYRNATVPTRLAIGASGTVLRSNGTDPAWAALAAADLPTATTAAQGAVRIGNDLLITSTVLNANKGTSFPGTPTASDLFFRTDFRAWFVYDGSAWRQTTVGDFTGSFPASPTTNLRARRIDRNMEYFWNGTYWLSDTEYECNMIAYARQAQPYSGTGASLGIGPCRTDYGGYVTRRSVYLDVLSTNNGTNYWTLTLKYGGVQVDIFSTAADAGGVGINKEAAVNTAVPTPGNFSTLDVTRTGAPSAIAVNTTMWYRLIG